MAQQGQPQQKKKLGRPHGRKLSTALAAAAVGHKKREVASAHSSPRKRVGRNQSSSVPSSSGALHNLSISPGPSNTLKIIPNIKKKRAGIHNPSSPLP